jgi:hypothetical protein
VLNSVLGEATFDLFQCDLVDFAFDHGVYEIGVVLDLDPAFYERRFADEITNKLWEVCKYGWSKGVVVTGYWHQIFQAWWIVIDMAARVFRIARRRAFNSASSLQVMSFRARRPELILEMS